jgi:hypothetical protein
MFVSLSYGVSYVSWVLLIYFSSSPLMFWLFYALLVFDFVVADANEYKIMMPIDTRKVCCCSLHVCVHYPMVVVLILYYYIMSAWAGLKFEVGNRHTEKLCWSICCVKLVTWLAHWSFKLVTCFDLKIDVISRLFYILGC